MKPRFFICDGGMIDIWNKYGVYFSEKFCAFFSAKAEDIMYKETGVQASYKVSLSVFRQYNTIPMYQPGPVSRINTAISILPEFTHDISFCWRSKSGAIVRTTDEDFDEADLECWIEGLEPGLYWAELQKTPTHHPLKGLDLPYELAVQGIGMHMGLSIELSSADVATGIIKALSSEVEKHNQKSEARGRKDGVVHNCSGEADGQQVLFRIDVGSAGVVFIKKLLRRLAAFPQVKKVIVDL